MHAIFFFRITVQYCITNIHLAGVKPHEIAFFQKHCDAVEKNNSQLFLNFALNYTHLENLITSCLALSGAHYMYFQCAGEVMMSFNYVVTPTRGNWFKTNSLEHEHDESHSCVHLLCVFYQW